MRKILSPDLNPSHSLPLPTSISTLPWPPSTKTLHCKIEEWFFGSRSFQCELGKVPSSSSPCCRVFGDDWIFLSLLLMFLLPSSDVSVAGTERK
jgi:hypothetical protein